MKVHRSSVSPARACAMQSELTVACDPGVKRRVCGPHCKELCPECGSVTCQCMCSHECENLPCMLSSDPENFPIEKKIAPLVFELKRTGLFEPCWSCEGHLNLDGKLWKVPQVWFYCDSTVQLRVLTDMLKTLEFRKATGVTWQVSVTHSDGDNPATTFALQPRLEDRTTHALADLQADVLAIAKAFSAEFPASAKRLDASVNG